MKEIEDVPDCAYRTVMVDLPAMCERIWNTDSTLAEDEFRKRFAHLASLADKL